MPWDLFKNIKYFEELFLDLGASLNKSESIHVSENSLYILSLGIWSKQAQSSNWYTSSSHS